MSVYYLYKLHRDSCSLLPANHTCEEMMRKYIRNKKVVDTRRETEKRVQKTLCVLISHSRDFYLYHIANFREKQVETMISFCYSERIVEI